MSENNTITIQEIATRLEQGTIDLIDVRTPVEFREVHASTARNVPLDVIDPDAVMKERTGTTSGPLYLICKSGSRAANAQQKFIDAGFTNVINVDGGTEAWITAKLPTVRGQKAMSLERQVRIAAGFIVFTGSVTTLITGNPYFASIPAFIGAGLMFAGISDTCGMGMMIAKMPWNQVAHNDSSCSASLPSE